MKRKPQAERIGGLLIALGAIAFLSSSALTAQRAAPPASAPGATPTTATEPPVDFNWDIRPILSENCFRCHGPDEKNRRANLRLDTPEGAYAALRRGNAAIVPGHPETSEVIQRITAENAAVRMPPASTNKIVRPEQVELIRRWIAQGGVYKPHWAFLTPTKPTVPAIKSTRSLTPIDRFVLARLER